MNERNKVHQAVIGLGSNISPAQNMRSALYLLSQSVEIEAVSSFWRTPAIGSSGPEFLNAAALVSTDLPAGELKDQVLSPIENLLGRLRTRDPNSPRTIDLDILIYDSKSLDPDLWVYAHIFVPVGELLPDFVNPESNDTLSEISNKSQHAGRIRKVPLEFHWSSPARNIV